MLLRIDILLHTLSALTRMFEIKIEVMVDKRHTSGKIISVIEPAVVSEAMAVSAT